MLAYPTAAAEQEIESVVKRLEESLRPDVVSIRYSFGEDWYGKPSVFFRVLLSDDASKPRRLGKVSRKVRDKLFWEVPSDEFGLHSYTNFRSKSEQDELQDPDWS